MFLSDIFPRFSKAALLLGFVMFGLFSPANVSAQQPSVAPIKQVPVAPDAKSQLKASLSELSTLYQKEVERLEKQQQQAKKLYTDGLISRVEFENGEKALAEACAKVESVAKEIALANQPSPVDGPGFVAALDRSTDLAWSTGNSRIDTLILQYGAQFGVDPYLIY